MPDLLKLAFIGQAEYNSPFHETDLDDLYQVQRFPVVFDPAAGQVATARTMEPVVTFGPDVAVFFRPEFFANDLLHALPGIRIGISTEPLPKLIDRRFYYSLDSIGRFRNLLNAADRQYDYIFHYDAASQAFMELMGARVSGFVALPVATRTWRPPAARHHDWDIAFLGRSTEHRERHFGSLKRDLRFLHIAHGIIGKDALPYYHAATIGLNIHVEPELAWEPRVQQLMAAGLIVVSEPISPNDYFTPGEHFIEVRDPAETYDACRDIAAHPDRYEHIRAAGHDRVQRHLSARAVWPSLIEGCLHRRFSRPAFDLGRVRLAELEACAEFTGCEHLLDQISSTYG